MVATSMEGHRVVLDLTRPEHRPKRPRKPTHHFLLIVSVRPLERAVATSGRQREAAANTTHVAEQKRGGKVHYHSLEHPPHLSHSLSQHQEEGTLGVTPLKQPSSLNYQACHLRSSSEYEL
ncbi:hypothetical protein CDL15_Pgr023611 [Punica granatum]|uniref:Uncharacterized protein n=1 Tax=Punica granatum TaxID=22663 RepID=A0A218W7M8_PUNGR|nr:hypothetical protein CDL15_Pgr023611 [Punica granatum]PKI76693.1 hypothetical protein CRG98_003002 [Punica granatum]